MHIILGGTGHIGSALARALLAKHEPVTIITRDQSNAVGWQQSGAQIAVADVHDFPALREVFRRGKRLFLLNPPAAPATNIDVEERRSLQAILAALDQSGLEKIVAQSTYGAQSGKKIGDLGVLYEMEEALAAQAIPASIIRAAYYLSTWDLVLPSVQERGELPTFYPPEFKLPMVAPQDIAKLAAELMTESAERTGTYFIEGPERYSPADVAAAFAATLGKPVEAVETPRGQWPQTLRSLGFSEPAAGSFANMTAATLEGASQWPNDPVCGETTLANYVRAMVRESTTKPR